MDDYKYIYIYINLQQTSHDCLLSMILRIESLRAWITKGIAVAFMYCSISVLAKVVARNRVVASSETYHYGHMVMEFWLTKHRLIHCVK